MFKDVKSSSMGTRVQQTSGQLRCQTMTILSLIPYLVNGKGTVKTSPIIMFFLPFHSFSLPGKTTIEGERRLLSSASPREEGGRKHGRAISSLELEQFSHLTLELTVNSYQLPHRMPGCEMVLLALRSQGEKGQGKISGCSGSSLGLPQRPPH